MASRVKRLVRRLRNGHASQNETATSGATALTTSPYDEAAPAAKPTIGGHPITGHDNQNISSAAAGVGHSDQLSTESHSAYSKPLPDPRSDRPESSLYDSDIDHKDLPPDPPVPPPASKQPAEDPRTSLSRDPAPISSHAPEHQSVKDANTVIENAKSNSEDTEVITHIAEPVTHETVHRHVHHIRHEEITREIHTHEYRYHILPIIDDTPDVHPNTTAAVTGEPLTLENRGGSAMVSNAHGYEGIEPNLNFGGLSLEDPVEAKTGMSTHAGNYHIPETTGHPDTFHVPETARHPDSYHIPRKPVEEASLQHGNPI